MGTHPIFESDFDCLTELLRMIMKSDLLNHYGFYASLLLFKVVLLSPVTGLARWFYWKRTGKMVLRSPEDFSIFTQNADRADLKLALEPVEMVERVRRCHRNDLEVVFNFLFIYGARLFITENAANSAVLWFTVARYLHTMCYLSEIPQPSRAICNSICNLSHWYVLLSVPFYVIGET